MEIKELIEKLYGTNGLIKILTEDNFEFKETIIDCGYYYMKKSILLEENNLIPTIDVICAANNVGLFRLVYIIENNEFTLRYSYFEDMKYENEKGIPIRDIVFELIDYG